MSRPPYRVPTMDEIRAVAWNGFTVASLFAGGGGSSTGYRMAGFRVAYANDVHAGARETYRANAAPYTTVDGGDIRAVSGARILDAAAEVGGLRRIDVLDGSPPCQAFSLAGPRQKTWGREVAHADGTHQRSDDLFFEYARLVDEVRPAAFVAENVSGLVRGMARGYFKRILAALREPGYLVEARLLDAQWLGVPQMRQRVVFVGVRGDIAGEHGLAPAFPSPLPYRYPLVAVCQDVVSVESHALRASGGRHKVWVDDARSLPARTITATGYSSLCPDPRLVTADPLRLVRMEKYGKVVVDTPDQPARTITADGYGAGHGPDLEHRSGRTRRFTIAELKAVGSFPPDYRLTGTYRQQWQRIGNSVPPLMMRAVAEAVRDRILLPMEAAKRG